MTGPRTSRADDARDFAAKSKFTTIDVPGANAGTQAFGINPKGDIVGTYYVSVPNNVLIRGFLLSKGSFTTIDVVALPGALAGTTNALGINPRGDIVGFYSDRFFNGHGFLLSKGSFTEIVVPAASNTLPSGINPKGDIVGTYFVSVPNNVLIRGFLLSKGNLQTSTFRAWRRGVRARGINPQGDIVGNYSDSSGNGRGFLLSHGRFTTIDIPGASGFNGTIPVGINPKGDIVGYYDDGSFIHGFLLSNGRINIIDVPGATFTQAFGRQPTRRHCGVLY